MIRQVIQRSANAFGYKIVRTGGDIGKSIDVFGLLVQQRFTSCGRDAVVIQIGANDGKSNDPVGKYIDRYHWRGLLVEPHPKTFKKLVERYRGEDQVMFENAAVGGIDGTMEFFCFREDPIVPEWASQLASLRRDILMRHLSVVKHRKDLVTSIQVPVMTFSTLLERHGVDRFDVLVIDTEGYDYEVLKSVDFRAHRPSIVFYEHSHLKGGDLGRARSLLADAGYQLCSVGGDTIAYLEEGD
ncbi:FkbM family methyltransferase [Paludisphaera sp.]|uniref:FkbM family methyltransferase n=1 Tax=Paludisphaera sp. TaxID=2017432 RepID=UPI00301C6376